MPLEGVTAEPPPPPPHQGNTIAVGVARVRLNRAPAVIPGPATTSGAAAVGR